MKVIFNMRDKHTDNDIECQHNKTVWFARVLGVESGGSGSGAETSRLMLAKRQVERTLCRIA